MSVMEGREKYDRQQLQLSHSMKEDQSFKIMDAAFSPNNY